MRPQRKKPGKGEQKKTTWSHEKLKGGGVFNGWLAGKTEWVLVHHIGVSKPCYSELSDDALPCPFCKPQCRRDWIGYVPIFDAGGKRLLVIVQDYAETVVDAIPVHAPVRVRRGGEYHDPVCVESSKWTADKWPAKGRGDQGVDIFAALLVLWNLPVLKAHFGECGDTPVSPHVPDRVEAEAGEEPPAELVRRVQEGKVTQSMRDAAPGIIADEVDRITWPGKPSKNGKHRPAAE